MTTNEKYVTKNKSFMNRNKYLIIKNKQFIKKQMGHLHKWAGNNWNTTKIKIMHYFQQFIFNESICSWKERIT